MKHFLEMAEMARMIPTHPELLAAPGDRNKVLDKLNAALEKAECFVFRSQGKPLSKWEMTIVPEEVVKAPPFAVFFVEESEHYLSVLSQRDGIGIFGVLTSEIAPDMYEFFLLCSYWEDHRTPFVLFVSMEQEFETKERDRIVYSVCSLVNRFINQIHEGKEGTEKVKKVFKIGSGRNKQKRTIRRVIHIGSKKGYESAQPVQPGRHIDWSHAWLVRGHWRTIKGLGKDRAGNYCIEGKTFVNPFQKGTGDLVHKTRIVEK